MGTTGRTFVNRHGECQKRNKRLPEELWGGQMAPMSIVVLCRIRGTRGGHRAVKRAAILVRRVAGWERRGGAEDVSVVLKRVSQSAYLCPKSADAPS